MATKYCRAAGGNWNTDATWSTTSSAGTANTTKPTAADDVILDVGSATIAPLVIDATSVCRSLNCTGFINTLTHNAFTLSIGDATAGTSNVALTLVSGMTYTLANALTSAITFKSTSATQQTIATGTKTLGNVIINGAGSSYILSDNLTSSGSFTYTAGTTFNTTTGSRLITLNGASVTFTGGNKTYYELDLTGSGTATLVGTNTFTNLKRNGTSVKTDILSLSNDQTVTGILTFAGQSVTNRIYVISDTIGTTRTITNTGVTHTWSNADFRDIALTSSFNAAAISGNSGDAGGNSNITFTTAVAQTSTGTSSFTWSTHGWTTRVPLPQDDVTINNTFSASQTVTIDMPRLGKNITFSSNTVSISCTVPTSVFGSISFTINIGTSGWTGTTTLEGRNNYTITNGGTSFNNLTIAAPGGTYTSQDALAVNKSGPSTFTITDGTYNANNFNVSTGLISITGTRTRTVTMGSGTWSYNASSGSGTPWNATVTTNLTFNANTSIIKAVTNSSSTKPFSGGGLTYNNVWFSDAGTGANQMIGSNTFNNLKIDPGRTLNFTAGTTTTVTSATISGTSGSLVTIGSITAASHTLTKSGGGQMGFDWMSISRSTATPSLTWYAGSNSTDGGNNSGWAFANLTGDAVIQTVVTSVLSPTIIAAINDTETPSVLTVATSVLAPIIISSPIVKPTIQTITTSVLAPTIIAEVDITVTPSVFSVATSILSPTESGTANITAALQTVTTSVLAPIELWDSTISVTTLQVTDTVIAPLIKSDYIANPTIQTVSTSILNPTEFWDSVIIVTEQQVSTSVINPSELSDSVFFATILTILTETLAPSERLDITVTPIVLEVLTECIMPSIINGGNATFNPSIEIIVSSVINPSIKIDSAVIPVVLSVATSIVNPNITASIIVSPTIQTVVTDINSPSEIIDALLAINTLNVITSIMSPVFEGDVIIQPDVLTVVTSVETPTFANAVVVAAQILEIIAEVLAPTIPGLGDVTVNAELLTILTEVLSPKIPTNKGVHLNVTVDKERNLNIKVTKYVSLNILKDSIHN